jgi:hypothetical protein
MNERLQRMLNLLNENVDDELLLEQVLSELHRLDRFDLLPDKNTYYWAKYLVGINNPICKVQYIPEFPFFKLDSAFLWNTVDLSNLNGNQLSRYLGQIKVLGEVHSKYEGQYRLHFLTIKKELVTFRSKNNVNGTNIEKLKTLSHVDTTFYSVLDIRHDGLDDLCVFYRGTVNIKMVDNDGTVNSYEKMINQRFCNVSSLTVKQVEDHFEQQKYALLSVIALEMKSYRPLLTTYGTAITKDINITSTIGGTFQTGITFTSSGTYDKVETKSMKSKLKSIEKHENTKKSYNSWCSERSRGGKKSKSQFRLNK